VDSDIKDTLSRVEESRDRYTLSHVHGTGGMGRVWLALDKALGRLIALKELRPDQAGNESLCTRFLREAKITAQLEHPGIVPVYELGQGEVPYYTMRFVRGRTLSEAIKNYHAQAADPVAKIELMAAFVAVCHAMAYAHSRGIIHRDLKGQNVALGDFGEVMVLDWGLAKRVGPGRLTEGPPGGVGLAEDTSATEATAALPGLSTTLSSRGDGNADNDSTFTESDDVSGAPQSSSTLTADDSASSGATSIASSTRPTAPASGAGPEASIEGQLLGTPGYMAPEQARGRHDLIDERTDVYGLGAILYEILTGRPPFIAPKVSEIMRQICHDAPQPPRQFKAGIERPLEAICLKALQKRPEERYATAAALAQDVQRWLADLPVRAYAEPWTSRAWRWARRHKTTMITGAGLLISATMALALSYALVSVERTEADAQGKQARHAVWLLTKVADIGFDDQLNPLQKEFLEGALAYYNQFTTRVAGDPAVRQERGKIYQQMGDILRKLGRMPESEAAYRQAIEIVEPLALEKSAGPEPLRALARTRTLLADLLVRVGRDRGQADPLFRQALLAQQALVSAPAATTLDRLRLGQTLKSQGDLLRLNGQFTQAKPIYDQAIAVLEQARADLPKHVEIRNDLAMATDARGWSHRELGDVKAAEQDFGQALALLDNLLAESPTGARCRDSLARVCNSLALIEESAGRLVEAEAHLRRELTLVERLATDFPDRPEHIRELARTWMNLGNVLSDQAKIDLAEPALARAVELNTAIAANNPQDVQIRLDLSKCHNNLGELLRVKGEIPQALKSFVSSRSISEKLVEQFHDKPRYREELAGTLMNLALAQEAIDPGKADPTYQTSLSMFEKLVADYPDNVEYRIGLARCVANFGPFVAASKQEEKAEALFRKALAVLDTKDAAARSPATLRQRAIVLNNFGDLELSLKRPQAEKTLRDALGTLENLRARESPSRDDRRILASVQANLGEFLLELKRYDEAGPYIALAKAGFERLITEQPASIVGQSCLGIVLEAQARLLDQTGNPAEAKIALDGAIAHQRHALKLSHDGPSSREQLASHLLELARVDLELGADDEAAKLAIELPRAVRGSGRAQACFDAARLLARVVARLGGAVKLEPAERDRRSRNYVGRIAVLLREAIDTDPKLAEPIKTDADIRQLGSRREFRELLNTLVELGP